MSELEPHEVYPEYKSNEDMVDGQPVMVCENDGASCPFDGDEQKCAE